MGLGRGFLPSGWAVGVRGDFYFYFFHFWSAWWACRSTNEYRTEILYVNYIIMKIYVLAYTNIFFFIKFLFMCNYYCTPFSYHEFHTYKLCQNF